MAFLDLNGLSHFKDKLVTIFAPISHGHSNATTTVAGFMSPEDKDKLNQLTPGPDSAVYIDANVTIQVSDWSSTAPYSYTYVNSFIDEFTGISVFFRDGVRNGLIEDLSYDKVEHGIVFTTESKPVDSVPLIVRIVNGATNTHLEMTASYVETDAVSGQTNVQGALESIVNSKADKVTSATNGHVAKFDSNGNIADSGYTISKSVPSNAAFTDTTYSNATQSANGLMSSTDKTKLDGIATGATANTGDVVGPSSSVNSRVAVFNGTTGKAIKDSGYTIAKSVPSSALFTDTTYSSLSAANGGTAVSLVTTGEKYTWNAKTSNTGTVTSVAAGAGLAGGTITMTGTVKANLTSETKLTNAAADDVETSGRVYPIRLDKNGKLACNVPWTNTTYSSKAAASDGTAVSLVTTGEKYTWNSKTSNTGTVTSVATGVGLTGGPVTTSGTIKANLTSETKLTNAAADGTETSGRVYPVRLDKNGKLACNVPWTNTTYSSKSAASGGTDVSLVTTGEKYTWNSKTSNTGTVTSVAAGAGLSGGTITTTGTLSISGMDTSAGSTIKCLTQKGTWAAFTNNAGTITGIKMNGGVKGTSGVVDLGTIITEHQDISGKANLSGATFTGTFCYKSSDVDLSKTNNNVSSSTPIVMNAIRDTGSRALCFAQGTAYSDGKTRFGWYLRNYNTSGETVATKGVSIDMAKDGTVTYSVSNPDRFRSAIGATDNTGTVTSVATGAGLTGGPITTTGTISINGMDTSSGSTAKCLTQKGTWASFTNNAGTVTGVKMNGTVKGTSGVVDLGTVVTDVSAKVTGPNSATSNAVAIFDGTGGKKIKNSGFTIGKSVPSDAVFTDHTYSNASESTAGLVSTSNQTFSGQKVFKNSPGIYTEAADKFIHFYHNTDTNGVCGSICMEAGNATNQTSNRFMFREYSPKTTDSSANTGYYEQYMLPAPNKGLSENKGYVIYTTKNLTLSTLGGAKETEAVKTISRSGTTFTATRCDGSTFSFTQQDNNTTYADFSAATSSAAGTHGLVPAPAAGKQNSFLRGDKTWAVPTNTTYAAATTNAAGLVSTGTQSFAGVKTFANTTDSSSTTTGAVKISGGLGVAKNIYGLKVYNAVWNDYAECREAEVVEGGYCVTETKEHIMKKTTERLMAGCKLTSDTYGHCMGETEKAKTPVAVAGRVLAYPFSDPSEWELGSAVCSAPNGTIDIMTREEIREYPERIIGTISEIPDYDIWEAGSKDNPHPIKVNGRIWIYVR